MNMPKCKITLISLIFLSLSTSAYSEKITTYEDVNGTPLFTNKTKPLKKVAETYYASADPRLNNQTLRNKFRPSKNNSAFDSIIHSASKKHGVDPKLIKAVIQTESAFNTQAVSPVGAQGLMQLMPATARRFNVSNSFNAEQNINAGAHYLSWLLKRFNGDVRLALAGYNAGEGNVDKYGGIPPFKETQNYVVTVLAHYNKSGASNLSINNPISVSSNATARNKKNDSIIKYSNDSFGDMFANN